MDLFIYHKIIQNLLKSIIEVLNYLLKIYYCKTLYLVVIITIINCTIVNIKVFFSRGIKQKYEHTSPSKMLFTE